jgi:hypothetical protein
MHSQSLAILRCHAWEPAGQISARLAKVAGPESAKAKTTPKGKATNKTIPRQITILAYASAVAAIHESVGSNGRISG